MTGSTASMTTSGAPPARPGGQTSALLSGMALGVGLVMALAGFGVAALFAQWGGGSCPSEGFDVGRANFARMVIWVAAALTCAPWVAAATFGRAVTGWSGAVWLLLVAATLALVVSFPGVMLVALAPWPGAAVLAVAGASPRVRWAWAGTLIVIASVGALFFMPEAPYRNGWCW